LENKSIPHWPAFLVGLLVRFAALLSLFLLLNVVAAHFMSECGLPAVLGAHSCSDDIVRIGWPLKFYEEGGVAFHSYFSQSILITDVAVGVAAAIIIALGTLFLPRRHRA
jgi:hypothetical protein